MKVIGPDHPWVSRGGIKLAFALDTFQISAAGAFVLDVGASTGGFTDVWLHRGARQVIALDVGHGQLHWQIRSDPRVTVIEHFNARYLKSGDLPETDRPITRVSIDVSFISLRHIFPVLPALVAVLAGPHTGSVGRRTFYIIENGVRLTGMPAWGTGQASGESASWMLVHFIRHLPELSEAELPAMVRLNPVPRDEVRQRMPVPSPPASPHKH